MKRRELLKQLGLGLSAGVLIPPFLESCSKDNLGPEVPYDGNVIVIGAGAAGLYAADILRVKGIKVTVLEASSQPGGRVRSLRNQTNVQYQTFSNASQADFPVELGAEVIYGSNSSWGKIISDLSITTKEISPTAPRYILDNAAKPAADWASDSDFTGVQTFVSGLPNYVGSSSMQSAAGLSNRAQALLNSQTGNYFGSSSDKVSAGGVAESLKLITHDSKQLTTFANPWQDILISRFNGVLPQVKFNTVVSQIDWGNNEITVTTKDGTKYTCTKLVVTVPISILKTTGISFSPALPSVNTNAFIKFGMDPCIRMILDFKSNFWGLNSSFIWGGTTVPQYFNSGVNRSQLYRTLSLTIYGQKAQQLSSLSDLEKVKLVLSELDLIYAGQGTKYIRRDLNKPEPDITKGEDPYSNTLFLIQDWAKDDFTKGGFSYPLVGTTLQDRKNLAAVASNRIYFAGEATDFSGDAGTVSGALNSAVRVVEEIVKAIQGK